MKGPVASSNESATGGSSAVYTILRLVGFLALALMIATIVYAGWIAIENWTTIRV